MKKQSIILISVFFTIAIICCSVSHAQNPIKFLPAGQNFLKSQENHSMDESTAAFNTRNNYGATLEPMNKVLHGAGQSSLNVFYAYGDAIGDNNLKPSLFMNYISTSDDPENKINTFANNLANNPKVNALQLGFDIKSDLDNIASGSFDLRLEEIALAFENFPVPIYMRIGYEANGAHNNYNPATYRTAFRKIVEKFREHNINFASVWCILPKEQGFTEALKFYPGDGYVDWWAIDLFSEDDIFHPDTLTFLKEADKREKPVMIGESTPRYIGVNDGQADWDDWFAKYFSLINDHKGIKAFCYINWDWPLWGKLFDPWIWQDWDDARLQTNAVVLNNYRNEMQNKLYQHIQSQQDYYNSLVESQPLKFNILTNGNFDLGAKGFYMWNTYKESGAQLQVINDNNNELGNGRSARIYVADGGDFNWHAQYRQQFRTTIGAQYKISFKAKADQATNINLYVQQFNAPYTVYDNVSISLTEDEQFFSLNTPSISASQLVSLSFILGNAEGREIWIDDVVVEEVFPKVLSQIENSQFNDQFTSWDIYENTLSGADMDVVIDNSSVLSGENSARFTTNQLSASKFDLHLHQSFSAQTNRRYKMVFTAKAQQPVTIPAVLAENNYLDPTTAIQNIDITTEAQSYEIISPYASKNKIWVAGFILGDIPPGNNIWIDKVKVLEYY